jgi:DnaJ-class molecular chaperone
MVQSLLNHANKSVNDVLNLLMNAAGPLLSSNAAKPIDTTKNENENNYNSLKEFDITENSDCSEIKTAKKKMSLKYHSDKCTENPTVCNEKFTSLTPIFQDLIDKKCNTENPENSKTETSTEKTENPENPKTPETETTEKTETSTTENPKTPENPEPPKIETPLGTVNARGGTRKIKNKYTKKYYLNRIHNTIKNFYKTNKRKSRYNKKRL